MKLINAHAAQIPKAKIVKYLLSSTHRAGKSKAAFFKRFGFTEKDWEKLLQALRRHAMDHSVVEIEETSFGTRYIIDGILIAPNGLRLNIRSAWFMDRGKKEPRFITAYPLRKKIYDPRT